MPSGYGWGALLSNYSEGLRGYRDRQAQEKSDLAKAALEEISRNMDEEKFKLLQDKFDWDKQMDLAGLATKTKKGGGGAGGDITPSDFIYFRRTKTGWTESDKGKVAAEDLNLLSKSDKVDSLPDNVYGYLNERRRIFGTKVMPDTMAPLYKNKQLDEYKTSTWDKAKAIFAQKNAAGEFKDWESQKRFLDQMGVPEDVYAAWFE
jgi:hypothetical protein